MTGCTDSKTMDIEELGALINDGNTAMQALCNLWGDSAATIETKLEPHRGQPSLAKAFQDLANYRLQVTTYVDAALADKALQGDRKAEIQKLWAAPMKLASELRYKA